MNDGVICSFEKVDEKIYTWSKFMHYYLDPSVTNFQESANVLLQQNVSTTVSVDVEITNVATSASGNDILAVSSGNNFMLRLQLSDVGMASNSDNLNLAPIPVTANNPAELQQGLAAMNMVTISATADVTILQSDCLNVHYLCALLSVGTDASYHDFGPLNNIRCKNIDAQKACDPGQSIFAFCLYI